jgi:4-carboxymuconolactone decarboxylase
VTLSFTTLRRFIPAHKEKLMSNLPLLGRSDLNAEQKDLWDYILQGPRGAGLGKSIKYLPGPFNPWMQIPLFGKLAAEMGERLRFNSVLPGKLRELAILTTGARWKAEFEFWAHARVARAEGLPDSIVNALQAETAVPYEDDQQRLVHMISKDLVETGRPRTHLAEQLADGLGWPAVVELVALVGFYCMVSFTLNAFDVPLPEGVAPVWKR